MVRKEKSESEKLAVAVINGMQQKNGLDIIRLDLSGIPNSVSNYFVICHGTSRPQIEAIADAVIGEAKKQTGDKPWHKEGFENAEWILIDYFDVVVHIFHEQTRDFYKLEGLWGDAGMTKFSSDK